MHVDTGPERVFRRPFSVAGLGADGEIELLIELRGSGTLALSQMPLGASLRILGPLGTGFTMPAVTAVKENGGSHAEALVVSEPSAAVVAGGIGVAGIRLLARRLAARGVETTIYVGARSSTDLLHGTLPKPEEVRIATDDGSTGARGTVCDLFDADAGSLPAGTLVYGCGPRPMLDALARIAARHGLACQVSLEEVMACGVGACRGCVVETVDGYRTVCRDGPVFDATKLVAGIAHTEAARG